MRRDCPQRHLDRVVIFLGMTREQLFCICGLMALALYLWGLALSLAVGGVAAYWIPRLFRNLPPGFLSRVAHRYGVVPVPGVIGSRTTVFRAY